MVKQITMLVVLLLFAANAFAQYGVFSKDELIRYTPENPYERYEDGRPKVPVEWLERMKDVSLEEAWSVLRRHGYHNQFAGNWIDINPDIVLVGRALTAAFMPLRPDLNAATDRLGEEHGNIGPQNSWVIDRLQEYDVAVVDLFGKVKDGTFVGDNLANALFAKTGGNGFVIDGGVRDLDGILEIEGIRGFVRGIDPTALAQTTLTGVNTPIRIGEATVMPGDVVLGRRGGIIFIPPHLVEEVVLTSEDVRMRDRFGHQMMREGVYTPGQIDVRWTEEIEAHYQRWLQERE